MKFAPSFSSRDPLVDAAKQILSESAKAFVDPVKNSKGLHNDPKPLGQASIKELEASKKWYQETIEKRKDTVPSHA